MITKKKQFGCKKKRLKQTYHKLDSKKCVFQVFGNFRHKYKPIFTIVSQKRILTPVQIEEEFKEHMPLFCETCNGRRLPKWVKADNKTQWICKTCANYVDDKNNIIGQSTKEIEK